VVRRLFDLAYSRLTTLLLNPTPILRLIPRHHQAGLSIGVPKESVTFTVELPPVFDLQYKPDGAGVES
jgi:hypothetical protein